MGRPRRVSLRDLERERRRARLLPVLEDYDRPKTRAECPVERPCPFVACKHHLYLDVTPKGSIVFNHPDVEPDELVESCALDVAERGGVTLEVVGNALNIVREAVRLIEGRALARIKKKARRLR